MLIICPSCVSTYRLPDAVLRGGAAAVRCAQCAAVFDPAARAQTLPVAVTISPAPAVATPPGVLDEPARRPAPRREAAAPRSRRKRGASVAASAAAVLALNMAAVAFRTRVAEIAPGLAPIYAAMGLPVAPALQLDGVATTLSDDGGGQVLAIAGRIANPGPVEAAVPNLRIVVRDAAEQSVYSWTTAAPQARLAPGAAVDFRSRLVAPPSTGHDVVVSFAGASDIRVDARVASTP